VNAVRILVGNGSNGSLDGVKKPTVIASADAIAADAYATLFGMTGTDISYVRMGREWLAKMDLTSIKIEEISADASRTRSVG
jgi:hypothetical protein